MNLLDKAIAAISPSWAYQRAAWRSALRQYDSGSMDRLNSGWVAVNSSAEQTNQPQRDIIRARMRDLERNSDIIESILGPMERNIVGTGIRVEAKIMNSSKEEDDELNDMIEDLWEDWSHKRNCDITGQQSFVELQQMAIRRTFVDGGIFFIKVYTDEGIVPFQLQTREVDELDTAIHRMARLNKNRIIGGIELNQYNKPVAYYFKKYTPDGFWTGQTEKIEAKRVIYLWKKSRPTQIREMTTMAKTMPRVRDVNEFVEAISVKERILACLAVFVTKQSPTTLGRGTTIDKQSGHQQRTITPGMIHELQPGESISAVNPSGQSSNAKDFITTQQRLAGAGQGLSYEAVSRDMSQVNYSSARQGLLEDQKTYRQWQQFLIEHLCREVYTEFVISAVLSGKLKIPDFWQNKNKYLKHEWIPPGWSWIDPLKEVKANEAALESGQDTLSRICAERGMDWRDVLAQRAQEKKYAQKLGLDIETGGGNGAGKTGSGNGDNPAKDD